MAQYEYRVVTQHRNPFYGVKTSIRQEKFEDLEEAQEFAVGCSPPKFLAAWTELREVGEWEKVDG